MRELVTRKVDQVYASTIRADRIGGIRNCGVGFTGSSMEGKVWPLRERIVPRTNSSKVGPQVWLREGKKDVSFSIAYL